MKIQVNYASTHPAIASDRAFFAAHPRRRFRARKLWPDELGLPTNMLLFGLGDGGQVSEINLVILQRFEGGRFRYHFVQPLHGSLNTDAKIEAFLQSRGVPPVRLQRVRRRA